jgi:alanine racemase
MDRNLGPIHPTHAIIDLAAFRTNVAAVRSCIAPELKIMAVVKADAYGHGMFRIAEEAAAGGVEYLGVARAYEGAQLRKAGVTLPVLAFEVIPPEHQEMAIGFGLDLTVTTIAGARQLSEAAGKAKRRARIHAKVDTGMGRLGFNHRTAGQEIEKIARLPWLELVGVYSHFATSEAPDQSFARRQLELFFDVLENLRRSNIEVQHRHMANSGAIMGLPESHLDMVRPGLMLYGYAPRQDMSPRSGITPVMSLVSHVAFLKQVAPDTSISYGRRYFTGRETQIATVPVGYGDGYSRLLTGQADVLIGGRRFPVVGTICMDQIMVDLGPDSGIHEGDSVTLIGRDGEEAISCWELAAKIGTIPYEITCLVTSRVPRSFIRGRRDESPAM